MVPGSPLCFSVSLSLFFNAKSLYAPSAYTYTIALTPHWLLETCVTFSLGTRASFVVEQHILSGTTWAVNTHTHIQTFSTLKCSLDSQLTERWSRVTDRQRCDTGCRWERSGREPPRSSCFSHRQTSFCLDEKPSIFRMDLW